MDEGSGGGKNEKNGRRFRDNGLLEKAGFVVCRGRYYKGLAGLEKKQIGGPGLRTGEGNLQEW